MDETLAAKADLEKTGLVLRGDLEKKTEAPPRGELEAPRGKIKEFDVALKKRMEKLEKRICVRFGAMRAAAAVLIVALTKFTWLSCPHPPSGRSPLSPAACESLAARLVGA